MLAKKEAAARAEEKQKMTGKIRIETVAADDFTMDYFRFGHGDQTLVILPGLSVESVMKFADTVAPAYASFEDRFTVYVFDRRKELPPVYTNRDIARDTAAAIRIGSRRMTAPHAGAAKCRKNLDFYKKYHLTPII